MAFNEEWDEASPGDDDSIAEGDNTIRQFKRAVSERLSSILSGWTNGPLKILQAAFDDNSIDGKFLKDQTIPVGKFKPSTTEKILLGITFGPFDLNGSIDPIIAAGANYSEAKNIVGALMGDATLVSRAGTGGINALNSVIISSSVAGDGLIIINIYNPTANPVTIPHDAWRIFIVKA